MKKKFVAIIITCMIAVSLAACSTSGDERSTPSADSGNSKEQHSDGTIPKPSESHASIDDTSVNEINDDNGYFYEFGYFLEVAELDKSPEEMVEKWKNGEASPFRRVELSYDKKGNYTQLHFPGQETVYVSCQGEITPGVKMTGAEYDVSDGSILRTYEYYVWWEGDALYINRENSKPDEAAYFMLK